MEQLANKYSIYQEVDFNNVIDVTIRVVSEVTGLLEHEQKQLKSRVCNELEIACLEIKKRI